MYFVAAVMIAMKADAPGESRTFAGRPPDVESQVCQNSPSGLRNPYSCASHFCKALKLAKSASFGVGDVWSLAGPRLPHGIQHLRTRTFNQRHNVTDDGGHGQRKIVRATSVISSQYSCRRLANVSGFVMSDPPRTRGKAGR